MMYIHQWPDWPTFAWDNEVLAGQIAAVRYKQGRHLGKMEALGFELRAEASLTLLTDERLFGWHAALFPTGRSGMRPIAVGAWRKDEGWSYADGVGAYRQGEGSLSGTENLATRKRDGAVLEGSS